MRVKMETGCGMTKILMAGCEIQIIWQERDLLILTGGIRESLKIDCGMRDKKQKIIRYRRYALDHTLSEAGRDTHSYWDGMAGLNPHYWQYIYLIN